MKRAQAELRSPAPRGVRRIAAAWAPPEVAQRPRRSGRRLPRWLPLAAALALLAALCVAALRVDQIRVGYGLAQALEEEKALLDQRREALARLRALRDPARLASLAARHGLVRPARIVDLPPAAPARKAP
jgi:hypothetical protein